ncbi:MAG: M23 family metallopeptidase, partial [Clostridia bacterium]|nr:M23 family metallopeptidase [Clostridia bacterium]
FTMTSEPVFSGRLIKKGAFTSIEALQEHIKATSPEMLPAYGVYVKDEIIFSLPNKTMAAGVLEDYKEKFTQGKAEITASFCDDVTVSYRFVPKSSLKTPESAALALEKGRIVVHKTQDGETLDTVAMQYGITAQDLLAINPIADSESPLPKTLTIQTGKPLLSVKTVELRNFNEKIPFETVENEDPTQYEGHITVKQNGVEGEKAVMAYITCINGAESERSVVSENLLRASVEEIVVKGTKEPPSPIGTGELVTPTAAGSLSSRFGSRWGRKHQGIDLAAATGTEIYAADNGTVIYSKYNDGGYGYMLQIDHGNGIVTYYAHCNELLVPEGTVVGKGDLVARVGNTGRSTGAHLHFEVRENGVPIDPLNYLKELS